MLLKVDTEDKELIILGDFNIDLMSDNVDTSQKYF